MKKFYLCALYCTYPLSETIARGTSACAKPSCQPAPQSNHHSAEWDEHERIDLHPLRRLLHPRPETFRAAGGPHRQVWPYAATLPEGTPARPLQQLDFERKLYPHLLEIDRAARERMDAMLPRMMEAAGVTEELKARDPMRWVGLMNTLKAQAEEAVITEIIME